ncbi:HAD family hydrolase [Nocardia bhagyanarayanae]|uniref:Putative hydrolase of the HAD superfamily n=1 Tax=Nocardia bhagyanarayanae TaxID=1215925 RepID=A0A543FE07_9NOCA|nr:HAD family phosphatase [Nocardia bhagyanarayanae]TQM32103.1 putative hydrolase of the HAD superfamily [Nocardia bhagyanarayanae]
MTSSTARERIAIWSDFGGVLTPPVAETFAAFCAKTGLAPDPLRRAIAEVTATFGTEDMMLPLDTPLIGEDEWLDLVRAALRRQGVHTEVPSLAETWFDGRKANAQWDDALRRYRDAGHFVGMLSNMPPAWEPHWRRMVVAEELFEEIVNSAQVGCRKPDPEIFELAAARAGVEPNRCVLIDDLPQNCAGARSAGWRAVLFRDAATATAEVDAELRQLVAEGVAM